MTDANNRFPYYDDGVNAIKISSDPAEDAAFHGYACWRRGIVLFMRAPLRLFMLAVLAQYAILLPDWLPALVGGRVGGVAALALSAGGLWLEALCYAMLIHLLDAMAGGNQANWRQAMGAALYLAVAGILYTLAVAVGLALFLLPAVFLSIALLFFAWPIVLEGSGPLAALEQSWRWTLPRFGRVSAAISIAFLVYGAYSVLSWWPSIAGVAWQPLATLLAGVRSGATGPLTAALQAQQIIVPGAVAAPIWYYVVNPLLGGLVMPPVLGALYEVYRRLREIQPEPSASAAS